MNKTVPNGWVKIKPGDIGKFSTSSVDKKSKEGEEKVFLLNYMDVYNHSILAEDYSFQIVTAPRKQVLSSSVKRGDVFFTPSSETPHDIGHSAVFIGDSKNIVHSYHTIRFRSNSNEYLEDYFKSYAFQGLDTFEYFRKRATGSTRFTLSMSDFAELELILPSIQEQKKIASILTSIDKVIETNLKKINKLHDLEKATMKELLTKGISHTDFKDSKLGKIPKSWEVKKIGELGDIITGSTPSTNNREFYDGDFMFVSPADISDGMFISKTVKKLSITGLNKTRKIPSMSVMVVCIGSTIGKVSISTEECATNQQINTIIPKENDVYFLYFAMKRMAHLIKKEAGTQAVPMINKTEFSKLIISVPPIDEQKKIGRILYSIYAGIEKLNYKNAQTQSLKKSLMHDLLSGKVRVQWNQHV